jgi:GAF domain-containing protein
MDSVVAIGPPSAPFLPRAVLVLGKSDLTGELACRLQALGCAVRAWSDRLALAGLPPGDLLVLDADHPAADPAALLAAWRGANRGPAVVVSADSSAGAVAGWLERGADYVLASPVEPGLFGTVARACLRAAAGRQDREHHLRQLERQKLRYQQLSQVVVPIGIALSAERDFNRLLELILLESMALCGADGGSLYLRTDDDQLTFAITRNASLGIATGGTTGLPNALPPLRLYDEATGLPNHRHVASYAALRRELVNVADAYQPAEFDFAGPRAFDALTGYRSTSFLACPLVGSDQAVIGVLQLINALDPDSGQVIPFDRDLEQLLSAMASLAAVALEAYRREARLRAQLDDLRIEIDQGRKEREVAEITTTSYFRDLVLAAREYRGESVVAGPPAGPAAS